LYRPELTGVEFSENTAVYGPNIASYGSKIIEKTSNLTQIKLSNIGSGVKYSELLTLQLVDHDNQILVLDSSSQISISAISAGDLVDGSNVKRVTKGEVVFDNLVFHSKPGGNNVLFLITSNAIDSK
jgi:hypothetical protein